MTEHTVLIGKRLTEALKAKGVDTHYMAELLDVSKYTVNQWLKGNNLTFQALEMFGHKIGISLNWLIFGWGELSPPSNIQITSKEEELLQILRHIGADASKHLNAILQDVKSYNAKAASIDAYNGSEHLFDETVTGHLTVLMDGAIVQCSPSISRSLGYTCIDIEKTNIFDLLARDYHQRFRREMETVLTHGFGQYNLYDFVSADNETRISTIVKSSLIHFNGQLAFDVIVKTIS